MILSVMHLVVLVQYLFNSNGCLSSRYDSFSQEGSIAPNRFYLRHKIINVSLKCIEYTACFAHCWCTSQTIIICPGQDMRYIYCYSYCYDFSPSIRWWGQHSCYWRLHAADLPSRAWRQCGLRERRLCYRLCSGGAQWWVISELNQIEIPSWYWDCDAC